MDSQKSHVIAIAQEKLSLRPVYLDTETTGVNRSDEIVEISIIDHDGTELFSRLVKPSQPIPREAERIHGISNHMAASAQAWPIVWPEVRAILYGRTIAAYNAEFDLRMMRQSHQKFNLPWRENFDWVDVMALFSEYKGDWDPFRRSYKFHRLAEAGRHFGISLQNAHRSSADSLLTRAVLHSIAGIPY